MNNKQINRQIAALCNRSLSYTMRCFLDNRKGRDLVQSVAEFREYFSLSHEEASELVSVWQDLQD